MQFNKCMLFIDLDTEKYGLKVSILKTCKRGNQHILIHENFVVFLSVYGFEAIIISVNIKLFFLYRIFLLQIFQIFIKENRITIQKQYPTKSFIITKFEVLNKEIGIRLSTINQSIEILLVQARWVDIPHFNMFHLDIQRDSVEETSDPLL